MIPLDWTKQEADTIREALEGQRRPGVRWRLENLGRLATANLKKLKAQAEVLEQLLVK